MGGLADIQLGYSFATRVTNSRVAHQLGDTYATTLYTAYNAVGHGYPRADTWNATKMTTATSPGETCATYIELRIFEQAINNRDAWSDP